jgi:hypothetical protein
MGRSTDWFATLLAIEPDIRSEHWTAFSVAGGHLALHLTEEARGSGDVGLSLVVDEALEAVATRVEPTEAITEQPFGRSFTVADPDGTVIQVNEHHADR